ncbi:MAG: exonuclease SbcCD subunit D [Anaerolineales bacterium]|nr:exonuclease SbcCD subunit D [Anaerolineales bacterium]MCX7609865.1 exonuclease SbcCD subunit D [Anaerolineales bacterium]MDW8227152.1 exonuclease SbcCD subunit D [Anaerolineales bacterium]
MRLLHFADAHIDIANYGRHDPQTGLPIRVLDFLQSLDTIIETAIAERVDLVLFAGDAYKDRSPVPTYQREWGKRIMRLSQAGIRTLLLVGNHDLSPAFGRAHAVQEFDTLQVPGVTVLDRPRFLSAAELGLPAQVIALPWVNRSGLIAVGERSGHLEQVNADLEERLTMLVETWIAQADPALPLILTAHASVQGAQYGAERNVMLGNDWVLPGSLVRHPRLDYVALGHIHKAQNLNEGAHPPVIYPGSIERVDFGEAGDEKFFVLAEVERGRTQVEWRKLTGIRPFLDCSVTLHSPEHVWDTIQSALPPPSALKGAIVRLTITYPREWETFIDEASLRRYAAEAFEFHLVRRPQSEVRIRLPDGQSIGTLSPLELLEKYWQATHTDEAEALQALAREIIEEE